MVYLVTPHEQRRWADGPQSPTQHPLVHGIVALWDSPVLISVTPGTAPTTPRSVPAPDTPPHITPHTDPVTPDTDPVMTKTEKPTFPYVGKLQPWPVPDLDD